MPDWQDTGFVLAVRRFGENGIILSALTPTHGRHLGLFHAKTLPLAGSFVNLKWHARLPEHLGNFKAETVRPFSAGFMDDKKRLSAISSLCALLDESLPEREPVFAFYNTVCDFLNHLNNDDWQARYIKLELDLLTALGFGLDLSECAGGGNSNDLAYVSPKTGRAVSREKGDPFREKLLILPAFLWQPQAIATSQDLRTGLALTGYFLSQHIKALPLMRSLIL